MNTSIIISLFTMLIAAGALVLSILSTLKRNTKEDSATIAKMMTMLDSLASDMKEIKDDFRRDIAELKASHQTDHDRLVIVERDLKTAWKNIDEINLRLSHNQGGAAQ